MLLIPIGHDSLVVQRLPFATIGIMATCVVLFVLLSGRAGEQADRKQELLDRIETTWRSDEALALPPELFESLPQKTKIIEKTRAGWLAWYQEDPEVALDWLDRRGDVQPSSDDTEAANPAKGTVAQETSDHAKAAFLAHIKDVGLAKIEGLQAELNSYYEEYRQISRDALFARFGYVPNSPRLVGLFTYMFLHGGVMHLLFNLLFLWVAAVKLENIWGHFWFLALYLLFGVAAALFHQAVHPGSGAPLIGASGAVAGLMGAFAVRLTKSKIRFFYLYWFVSLTPKHGTFESPAYLMLPLWFLSELFSAMFFDLGPVAYWAHVGGFLTGACVAVLFRLTDFEQKILGREHEDEPIDPDAAPLVAFRPANQLIAVKPETSPVAPAPVLPSRPSAQPLRFSVRELSDVALAPSGLSGRLGMRSPMQVEKEEIIGIAAGRVDHLNETEVSTMIDSGLSDLSDPAYLALLVRKTDAPVNSRAASAYIIDGNRLKYEELLQLGSPAALRKEKAFVAFVKLLLQRFPTARYVPGTGAVGEHNLPLYADLESFFSSVRKVFSIRDRKGH